MDVRIVTREQIITEVKSLPPQERAELIEDLRQIANDDELTLEQIAELRRRVAAIDRGEMALVDGEQVMRELFERLNRR